MLYKMCPNCKKKYKLGGSCNCRKKETNKIYDKYIRDKEATNFYKSKEWKATREVVLLKYNYLDLYAYHKYKKIVKANLVHHITELKDDFNKRLDIKNLIPVSSESHNEIHGIYDKSAESKKKLMSYLYKILK